MRKLLIIILLILIAGTGWTYRDRWFKPAQDLIAQSPLSDILDQALEQESTLPGPLRILEEQVTKSFLTNAGVLVHTNNERTSAGLESLSFNSKLSLAAEAKLKDMFDKQYFEHISPIGLGPADLAKQAGYQYIIVGENLALGNFKDDAALVQGWMNSPGHRANILNTKYTDIGIAVGQGIYEGKKTWMAVQEFGTPLSNCPTVDSKLRINITTNETITKDLEMSAMAKRAEFESGEYENDPSAYNEKVREYNAIVKQINKLIDDTKTMVATYNAQVNAFNQCIKE